MAITENTILEVVRQLASAGTAPTVRLVREALGGGSNLRIMSVIKLWREEGGEITSQAETLPTKPEADTPEMPREVGIALTQCAEEIWQRAMLHARREVQGLRVGLATERQTVDAERKEVADERLQVMAEVALLQEHMASRIEELERELAAERASRLTAERSAAVATEKAEAALREVGAVRVEAARTHEEAENARAQVTQAMAQALAASARADTAMERLAKADARADAAETRTADAVIRVARAEARADVVEVRTAQSD